GYLGKNQALPIVIKGLKKLEYRGYDSFGFAVFDKEKNYLYLKKTTKRIKDFEKNIDFKQKGKVAISQTRWATHGGVSNKNAHPHLDCAKNIFVVHNGIIENFEEIKKFLLKKNHQFRSETDTEVIPHLIEEYLNQGIDYESAVLKTLNDLRGSFALVIFNKAEPEKLIGARISSPLVLGVGKDEYIFASDPNAINSWARKAVFLDDGELVVVSPRAYKIKNFLNNKKINKKAQAINFTAIDEGKSGFEHFMLKEIKQEPEAVKNTLRGRILRDKTNVKLGGLEQYRNELKKIEKIFIVACGTAYYAGLVGKYLIQELAGIDVEVEAASEFRYAKFIHPKNSLVIAISQSGETADTLEAVKLAKRDGVLTMGIVNVVGSSLSRLVDFGVYTYAGPEYAVASTKAFVSQIAALVLVGVFLARQRKMSSVQAKIILKELASLPEKINQIFEQEKTIRALAKKYAKYKNFLYLGRKYHWPISLEGALKLKEIAYVHSEAYPAGEMKHGPIALIDKNFPTVVLAPRDSVYEKIISNLQEIKARHGKIIVLTTAGNKELAKKAEAVIYLPKTLELLQPILTVVPLHLFAYYFAKELKKDIDRPRNLAKSVTVE
ncbi:MAG: glutamine--fructose-6-phosphate transaminase (isomerizing), partial [Patescibacteria group bacterium]